MSRLEEIIGVVNSQSHSIRKLSHNDLNWLIAQTQKAEELQAKVDELEKELNESIKRGMNVALENVRYQQALEEIHDFIEDQWKNHVVTKSAICGKIQSLSAKALKGVEGYERD